MRILHIVFLLSVCGRPEARKLVIHDILEIAKLSNVVTFDMFRMFKKLDKDVSLSSTVKGQKLLLSRFNVFYNKIDKLNAQFEGKGSPVLDIIVPYIDVRVQLKRELKEVTKDLDAFYIKYNEMGTLIEAKANDRNLEIFATSVVTHSNRSIQNILDRIHATIATSRVFTILNDIMKEKGNKMFCEMPPMSAQQLVLHLYNTLALTELKGFLMIEFSYLLLKLHKEGKFTKEFQVAQERYKNRSKTTLNLTIEAVLSASTEIWKCDPYKQVKNETYIEITELLQGYIENVKNLNEFNRMRRCKLECNSFKHTQTYNCQIDEKLFCHKNRPCRGSVINCESTEDATVCVADADTNRRYEYIEQGGQVLGRWKNCAHNSVSFKAWYWYRWAVSCYYCKCICDEKGYNSDRYFSLKSSESKIDQNMVVTGLRFVKKDRIIHLQIQEGKLLPYAKIDVASVHWKPVENCTIEDPEMLRRTEYHILTFYNRGFDLDDLVAKSDELVTGVRFVVIADHLNFQIRVTPFNFKTGRLEVTKSKWKHNEISQNDRKMIDTENKDIPLRSPDPSLPVSESGMYLEFTHSDWEIDVAQTTVPFIDAQAVASALPVPLSGAGMSYKRSKNFGGFINPKIMTYDYAKILRNVYDDTNYNYIL